jgi:hypothetical protein
MEQNGRNKAKPPLRLFKHYTVMTYAEVKVHLNEFMSSTVDAEELYGVAALPEGKELQHAMTDSDIWTIRRRIIFSLPEI